MNQPEPMMIVYAQPCELPAVDKEFRLVNRGLDPMRQEGYYSTEKIYMG